MENTEKLQKLREELEAAALAWADGINAGKPERETKGLKDATKGVLDAFNQEKTKAVYAEWAAGENPIETAIRALYIPGLKKVKVAPDKKTGIYHATISDANVKISLIDMQMQCGAYLFHDARWCDYAQKLAYLTANAVDESLGHCKDFQYIIDRSAQLFDFAVNADPKSNKSMVKAIQFVVNAILYIPVQDKNGVEVNALKATNKEWAYIRESITRQGKNAGEVEIGSYAKMVELITDAMYIILTEGKYALTVK